MIPTYNRTSLLVGSFGLVLQYGGGALLWDYPWIGLPSAIFGTIMIVIGLGYYLKSKSRSLGYLIIGVIPVLGLVVLGLLDDHAQQRPSRSA